MKQRGVFVAFSDPKSPDVEEQFDSWYNKQHVPDTLGLPGFVSGRRYHLAANQLAPAPMSNASHRHITIYELDDVGAIPDARALLPKLAAESPEYISPTVDSDGVVASIFEMISENTTPAILPIGASKPKHEGVPDGPPAIVVIFSKPKSEADEAEYNRWYDEVHTGETLLLPGFIRSRRFRIADAEHQILPHRVEPEYRYLTFYEVQNTNYIPLAREAMSWLKGVSVEFASPALDPAPPRCWTYELFFTLDPSTG